jgi:hypothetical protein
MTTPVLTGTPKPLGTPLPASKGPVDYSHKGPLSKYAAPTPPIPRPLVDPNAPAHPAGIGSYAPNPPGPGIQAGGAYVPSATAAGTAGAGGPATGGFSPFPPPGAVVTDTPDVNGAVKFTGVNDGATGTYGARRYLCTSTLAKIDPNSMAFACITINCNVAEQEFKTKMLYGASYPVIPNTPSGKPGVGVDAWRLDTSGAALTNTFNVPAHFNTDALTLTELNRLVGTNTNPGGGGNFSPNKP